MNVFPLENTTFHLRFLKCKRATRRFKEHPDCTTDLAAVSSEFSTPSQFLSVLLRSMLQFQAEQSPGVLQAGISGEIIAKVIFEKVLCWFTYSRVFQFVVESLGQLEEVAYRQERNKWQSKRQKQPSHKQALFQLILELISAFCTLHVFFFQPPQQFNSSNVSTGIRQSRFLFPLF